MENESAICKLASVAVTCSDTLFIIITCSGGSVGFHAVVFMIDRASRDTGAFQLAVCGHARSRLRPVRAVSSPPCPVFSASGTLRYLILISELGQLQMCLRSGA